MKKILFITIILCANFLILPACTNNAVDPKPKSEENNQAKEEEKSPPKNDVNGEVENPVDNKPDQDKAPDDEDDSPEVVLENEAFKIFEPAPNTDVNGDFVVSGLARVFEGSVGYDFEDGHFILDEGFTTATEGAPEWGEFEFTIKLDDERNYSGTVFLYEESAKDGSRMHEIGIPINVVE